MKPRENLEHSGLERILLTRVRLRQLSAFALIYELRNILKASKQLSLSQSTVSKSLRELEVALGQPLFTRSPRGVMPTPAGDALYRHTKIILNEFRHAADDLGRVDSGDSGQIVIGVVPPAMSVLSSALAAFKQARSKVSVRVLYGPDEELMSALSVGELDFVFGRLYDENRRTGLVHEAVYDDPSCIIVRNDHPVVKRRNLKLADLIDYPWILPPPTAYIRRYHDLAFINQGLNQPANIVETISMNVYRSLLLTLPNVVAILSDHALEHEIKSGLLKILPIEVATQLNPVGITTRANAMLNPPAAAFRETIRDTVSKIVDSKKKRVKLKVGSGVM